MTAEAKLLLKRDVLIERWEHREKGDYSLERFDKEFRDRLYSERGREVLRSQGRETVAAGPESER